MSSDLVSPSVIEKYKLNHLDYDPWYNSDQISSLPYSQVISSQLFTFAVVGEEAYIVISRRDPKLRFGGELSPVGGKTDILTLHDDDILFDRINSKDLDEAKRFYTIIGNEPTLLTGIREGGEEFGMKPKEHYLLSGTSLFMNAPSGHRIYMSSSFVKVDTIEDLNKYYKMSSEVSGVYALPIENLVKAKVEKSYEFFHMKTDLRPYFIYTDFSDSTNPKFYISPSYDSNKRVEMDKDHVVAASMPYIKLSKEDGLIRLQDRNAGAEEETLTFRAGFAAIACLRNIGVVFGDNRFDKNIFMKKVEHRMQANYTLDSILEKFGNYSLGLKNLGQEL